MRCQLQAVPVRLEGKKRKNEKIMAPGLIQTQTRVQRPGQYTPFDNLGSGDWQTFRNPIFFNYSPSMEASFDAIIPALLARRVLAVVLT